MVMDTLAVEEQVPANAHSSHANPHIGTRESTCSFGDD